MRVALTMAKRGMLAPGLPWRTAGQLAALQRWGYGLAGEVRQAAARSPGAVAVIDDDRRLTYAELVAEAEETTRALAAAGYGSGDRLGLLARNHAGAVVTMLGVSFLGADLVLLNTGLPAPQLLDVVQAEQLRAVLHDEDFADVVGALSRVCTLLPVAGPDPVAAVGGAAAVVPPARPGRTLVLTSGTSGHPKGAARPTPRGPGPLVSIVDRIPLRAGDRFMISAPIFHTWGYSALQLAFGMRATIILQRRFDAALARRALETEGVDVLFAVPVMLQRMLELPSDPDARARRRLRVVAASGSAFPSGFTWRFMDEFGEVLYNLYGSTEASWVCIATPSDLRRDADTAGTPPLGTRVAVLGPDLRPAPEGEVGRVFAGNDMVFGGYTDGRNKQFHDGMVSTGDLGHVRDGLYFIDGREDDLVVSGGENVYPAEVEAVLVRHPRVREAAALGVPDARFGERLAVVVARAPDVVLTIEDVRDHLRGRVARHSMPRDIVVVDELPRNATGKVSSGRLRDLLAGQ